VGGEVRQSPLAVGLDWGPWYATGCWTRATGCLVRCRTACSCRQAVSALAAAVLLFLRYMWDLQPAPKQQSDACPEAWLITNPSVFPLLAARSNQFLPSHGTSSVQLYMFSLRMYSFI
jgi:hypothetical protein